MWSLTLLESTNGRAHFFDRSSGSEPVHSRHDIVQGVLVIISRAGELRHLRSSGFDGALKSTRLPSEVNKGARLCQNVFAELRIEYLRF